MFLILLVGVALFFQKKGNFPGLSRGPPTLPIPKRLELNEGKLFWMKMSIMKQQKAYCIVPASLIKVVPSPLR